MSKSPPKKTQRFKAMLKVTLAFLASWGLWILARSWRVKRHPDSETQTLLNENLPAIFPVWHGRMYPILRGLNPNHTAIMISQSSDGEFIAKLTHRHGFTREIRGSHQRGGSQALRQMIKTLKQEKRSLTFATDGPRGPHQEVKAGIIILASMSQAPIIPLAASSKFLLWKFTRSWDCFHLPQFFTPMHIVYGKPFYVPAGLKDEDAIESYRRALETEMKQLTLQADGLL